MNIDKLIKDQETIYYKHIGPTKEFRIVKKFMLIPDQSVDDLSEILKEKLTKISDMYIALQGITNPEDSEIIHLDNFETYWYERHLKLKEAKDAIQSGEPLIKQFFKNYGVFHSGWDKKSYGYINTGSEILYDGYPTPNGLWNTDIKKASVAFYMTTSHNNYCKRYGDVWRHEISFSMDKEDLVDTESPTSVRICHRDGKLQDDSRYTHHYTKEEWNADIDKTINIYIDQLVDIIDNNSVLQCDKDKKIFYQRGKKYLISFVGNAFYRCELLTDKTYRDFLCNVSKTPKFVDTVTPKQIVDMVNDDLQKQASKLRNLIK